MTRKDPSMKTPPDVNYVENKSEITQFRHYKIITPLYGGGVTPNQADPITVVRGTEVRGHLRFWWRATQLGRFSSLQQLRDSEERVWGSSEIPACVKILVKNTTNGNEEHAYEVKSKGKKSPRPYPSNKVAAYAAFPLQPDKDHASDVNWESDKVLLDVEFTLEITFPEKFKKEIEDTIWAWQTFGGIGARTRRGFGAIKHKEHDDINTEDFNEWLAGALQSHVHKVDNPIVGIPYLSQNAAWFAFKITSKDPISCWKEIIAYLQYFRQDKARFGSKYGLSQWPEANAIRDIFNLSLKFPEDNKNHNLVKKFPRAKFGLPINFHLPHDKSIPDNLVLQGKQLNNDKWYDRMASPLILRPIECGQNSIGLAAVLQWQQADDESYTPPGGLRLKGAPNNPQVTSDLSTKDVSEIPMIKKSDVLKEFLDFFNSNGGR